MPDRLHHARQNTQDRIVVSRGVPRPLVSCGLHPTPVLENDFQQAAPIPFPGRISSSTPRDGSSDATSQKVFAMFLLLRRDLVFVDADVISDL